MYNERITALPSQRSTSHRHEKHSYVREEPHQGKVLNPNASYQQAFSVPDKKRYISFASEDPRYNTQNGRLLAASYKGHSYHHQSFSKFTSVASETDALSAITPHCSYSLHIAMNPFGLAIILIFLSIVVLVSTILACSSPDLSCSNGSPLWAIICSTVSILISVYYAYLYKYHRVQSLTVSKYLSPFLIIWWFGGVMVTFVGPFAESSSGYYGIWSAFGLSLGIGMITGDKKELRVFLAQMMFSPGKAMAISCLFLSSVVVSLSGLIYLSSSSDDVLVSSDERLWNGVLGGISCVACFGMLYCKLSTRFTGLLLVLWWTFGKIILSRTDDLYSGKHRLSGNGYYGSWIALFCSIIISVEEINQYGVDMSCFCCYDPDEDEKNHDEENDAFVDEASAVAAGHENIRTQGFNGNLTSYGSSQRNHLDDLHPLAHPRMEHQDFITGHSKR